MAKKGRASAPKSGSGKSEPKTDYIVQHRIINGKPVGDGTSVMEEHAPGSTISLTDSEAAEIGWAIKKDQRREGQTSRLKRQIAELQQREKELLSAADASAKRTGDPNLAAALDSIRNRADNTAGRGEVDEGRVSPDVVQANDRREAAIETRSGDVRRVSPPSVGNPEDVVGGHGYEGTAGLGGEQGGSEPGEDDPQDGGDD